ncbi:MAG: hypothetical protein Crog4KO_06520 [Crocinitomicaceae bacterium]
MGEHIKRKMNIGKALIPEEGTEAHNNLKQRHEKAMATNPEFKKAFKERFRKASNTLHVQGLNGIGLNMDEEIRNFLLEFNSRAWEHGLRKMPSMFNIMEAFFNYDHDLGYFELIEDEDYLISFFDFMDFYTSPKCPTDQKLIVDSIEKDLIYNFNVGADIEEITFKSEEGEEFVVGGASMIRRENEITILLLAGELADTESITKGLKPLPKSTIPGKEKLRPADNWVQEAAKLNGNPNHWKVLISCRFDLDSSTLDARYVAHDMGDSYNVMTDDIEGFLRKGKFISEDLKEFYYDKLVEIEKYKPIFELAKTVLCLPYYFNQHDKDILDEEHETKYKSLVKTPVKKQKFRNVENKFRISSRTLWILNKENKFSSDRITIHDDQFKIEKTGYWKRLNADEFGTNKKGDQITGKTWVNRTESFYEAKTDELIVKKKNPSYEGENAGYIYVMRNPMFPDSTFKIGLTTNDTSLRAKQLSKTSVADKFHVMNEWATKDCYKAEKEIHRILDKYRVDKRREFFTLDMKEITKTIEDVLKQINA